MLRLEPPSPPLDDGVVRLEPLTLDDEADVDAIARDPEVARFTYVPDPPTEGFARSWIERYLRGWEKGALALLSSWALEAGLLRVELRIDVENTGSIRVAERAGFVREGVLRSAHFKEGRRSDVAVYSLLPGDVLPAP